MEKVHDHIRSCGVVARTNESTFFEGTSLKQLEVRFPNGSVIYGLPANPDTARGYSGHVTLDEFAFHADADKIYAALFPTITRGYGLEVISTPNGTQGKFYELAKAAGLTDTGVASRESGVGKIGPSGDLAIGPSQIARSSDRTIARSSASTQHLAPSTWSAHLCDIYDAVRDGLKIDVNLLRSGCEDATAWQQEFCCQFVSTAENFFPPDLLAACLSAEASTETPSHLLVRESESRPGGTSARGTVSGLGVRDSEFGEDTNSTTPSRHVGTPLLDKEGNKEWSGPTPDSRLSTPEFFLGIDIGRHHDRTVMWVDEVAPLGASKLENGNWKLEDQPANFHFPVSSFAASIGNHQSAIINLSITRMVRTLENTPFAEQLQAARELLRLEGSDGRPLIRRACIDATGMGAPLAESLAREFGPRVEPVVFTAAVKEDLAFRTKRRMEARLTLLPDTRDIRRAFSAVKKFITPSGNLRFDAVRTEAGHADEFWAKALADLAADPEAHRAAARADDAFLADAVPIVNPMAFREVDLNWSGIGWN